MKAIYQGPSNYWTEHTLVPGEKYMYGYYGFYSPEKNPKYYKNIQTIETIETENKKTCAEKTCGSCNITLGWAFLVALLMVLLSYLK